MKLHNPKKIVVWGTVASGKTTLTKHLGSIFQIPNIINTDNIFYNQKHSKRDIELIVSQIETKLSTETWIVDGSLDEKISREEIAHKADMIIVFHYPVGLLLKRMILRDWRDILNPRKSQTMASTPQFLAHKLQMVEWFIKSFSIIKNYNRNFIFEIQSIIKKSNTSHKTFIISSRQKLEELLILVAQ